jgi:hypothetical protein
MKKRIIFNVGFNPIQFDGIAFSENVKKSGEGMTKNVFSVCEDSLKIKASAMSTHTTGTSYDINLKVSLSPYII